MPIENEAKFVLHDPNSALFEILAKQQYHRQSLLQIYLKKGARIRRINDTRRDGIRHIFTYKRSITGGRNIEIETDISEDDFSALATKAEVSLQKERFKFSDDDVDWDVDFLRDGEQVYFALAEAEMPETQDYPRTIPTVLAPYVIYTVPRDYQKYYQSKALARPDYARRLMERILSMEKI